jgi:hypothetical protein
MNAKATARRLALNTPINFQPRAPCAAAAPNNEVMVTKKGYSLYRVKRIKPFICLFMIDPRFSRHTLIPQQVEIGGFNTA